jgi:hypothetical protein
MPKGKQKATRQPLDFYETRRWQLEALLSRVRLRNTWEYFEPCAGNGAISSPLVERGYNVVSNDIVARTFLLDMCLDARDAGVWAGAEAALGRIDVTISNFPFSSAFPMVQHAVRYSRKLVIALLRSTWDEPTKKRGEWLLEHPPTAQISMPRAKYTGTGSSESCTHHWFIWAQKPELETFHHDTVTWAERDYLVKTFGGKL